MHYHGDDDGDDGTSRTMVVQRGEREACDERRSDTTRDPGAAAVRNHTSLADDDASFFPSCDPPWLFLFACSQRFILVWL